jgi:hypothetical protein
LDKHKHLTDLRATAPAALEDISEDAWLEFQKLQQSREGQFAPTRPMTGIAPLTGDAPQTARPAPGSVSVDQALQLTRRNNRVCPMPERWRDMFDLMASIAPGKALPPVVIDGAAWSVVPPMQKRIRLREQLEWAERLGLLDPVFRFLQDLPDEGWLHF